MTLADSYRALGLRESAAFKAVKGAYRQLARQYHPDTNAGDEQAKVQFIRVTEAYREIVQAVQPTELVKNAPTESVSDFSGELSDGAELMPQVQVNPALSNAEQQLKQSLYPQLQRLFRQRRLPRAIALVEGLAQRLPKDSEVKQWQAITYERWGRDLIAHYQFSKARVYLKKALATDPYNKSLWHEVNRDFFLLDQTLASLRAEVLEAQTSQAELEVR